MKIHAFILVGCFVIATITSVWGQALRISKLDYDIRDGLPGMQVMSLHQDSRGHIIVGTKGGACVFDGQEFHSYKTKVPLDVYSQVHQITERSDQTLWFSTSDGILSYDGTTTQTLLHSDSLDTQYHFIKGKADAIYFINKQKNKEEQDDNQLYKLENTSFALWEEVNQELTRLDAVPAQIGYTRELDKLVLIYAKRNVKDRVYIALIDEATNVMNTIAEYNSFDWLSEARDGYVYILCGKSIFKIKEDGLELVVQLPNILAKYRSFLAVNNRLFYGGGSKNTELYKIEVEPNGAANIINMGVSIAQINAMLLDDDNRLWLGKEDGLSVIPNEAFWEYPYQGGVKGVWSIAQDGNNDLWFASFGYGLSKYHYEEDSFEVIDLDKRGNLAKTGARYMYFGSMSDSNGDVYFPMEKGVIKYDVAQDKLLELNNDRFRKPTMYAYEDQQKRNILFGSTHVLFYDKKKKKVDTLSSNRFELNTYRRTINQDKQGIYWLGGAKGLWKGTIALDSVKQTTTLQVYRKGKKFKGGVLSSLVDKRGGFWIGTGRDLYQYQEAQDTFIAKLPPKMKGAVLFIQEMSDTTLLLTSAYELVIYNTKTDKPRSIGLAQGFTGLDFAQNGIIRDHKGYYWTCHADKIVRFDPTKLPNPIPPKSYIVSFKTSPSADKEEVFNHIFGDTISSSINRVRIKFSATAFDLSEDFSFKIRLLGDGRDSVWKSHEEFFVDYDNLTWGSYAFELQACSETTGCEEYISRLQFYIKPSCWEKNQKFILVALIGLLILIIGYLLWQFSRWWHRKQLEQARKRREEVLMTMKAFNKQLDPHFLFNVLNNINSIIEQNYTQEATASIVKLSDMLRASMERSQVLFHTIKEELEFVELYTEVARIRYPNKFVITIEVSDEVGYDKLVPKMIIQSFVSNAIKHGIRAKEGIGTIAIRIQRVSDSIRITIQDDGVGINATRGKASPLTGTSQGERLIQEIIDYINEQKKQYGSIASCKIRDKADMGIGQGTLVVVKLPFELAVNKDGSLSQQL